MRLFVGSRDGGLCSLAAVRRTGDGADDAFGMMQLDGT